MFFLEYRSPYLIIVQFNSIEILLLDIDSSISAENCKLDRAYLSFPRYVILKFVNTIKNL